MLSCDTIALAARRCAYNVPLLAKNSDRALGEAQPLFYAPAQDHAPDETLRVTNLVIPQAAHTYAVTGCKPYWIWGFEMGFNECGLAIGNEAEGSRCEAESEEGLLGMDLLRLALERAADARSAIGVITGLLEQYGQNANANALYDRRYENSYLLTDREEVWLLETAGRQWAAKRLEGVGSISNCYTIGTDYDLCSERMTEYAAERRWSRPGAPVSFREAYSIAAPRLSNAVHRWRSVRDQLQALPGRIGEPELRAILRSHFEGELVAPHFGACFGSFVTVCMHASTWDGSQTAASFLYHREELLGDVLRYAPSLPCCSVYLPVYRPEKLPPALTRGGAVYEADSLWWRAERLAMAISIDEARFGARARAELTRLQAELDEKTAAAEAQARSWLCLGKPENAEPLLTALTEEAAAALMELTQRLADQICAEVYADGGLYGQRKEFLEAYCARTGLPL